MCNAILDLLEARHSNIKESLRKNANKEQDFSGFKRYSQTELEVLEREYASHILPIVQIYSAKISEPITLLTQKV